MYAGLYELYPTLNNFVATTTRARISAIAKKAQPVQLSIVGMTGPKPGGPWKQTDKSIGLCIKIPIPHYTAQQECGSINVSVE